MNRHIATEAVLPGARLVTLSQVHSSKAVAVTAPFKDGSRPERDALVTDRPGLALGIITADCAPILFADVFAGVVGAAHAGWKGAFGGITDATIAAMEALGAKRDRIIAAIGPCISCKSYEVDEAFFRRFVEADSGNQIFFVRGQPHHYQFDLEAYVAHRLHRSGVGQVEAMGLDTYSDELRFYSYRRATHRSEPDYGRQISIVGLE
jgi:hypothetical protein